MVSADDVFPLDLKHSSDSNSGPDMKMQQSLPSANPRDEVIKTSESSEKEGVTPPCNGDASFGQKVAPPPAKVDATKQQMRQPRNQLAQIEALLRTMSPNNPPAPPGNRRANFRGRFQ